MLNIQASSEVKLPDVSQVLAYILRKTRAKLLLLRLLLKLELKMLLLLLLLERLLLNLRRLLKLEKLSRLLKWRAWHQRYRKKNRLRH